MSGFILRSVSLLSTRCRVTNFRPPEVVSCGSKRILLLSSMEPSRSSHYGFRTGVSALRVSGSRSIVVSSTRVEQRRSSVDTELPFLGVPAARGPLWWQYVILAIVSGAVVVAFNKREPALSALHHYRAANRLVLEARAVRHKDSTAWERTVRQAVREYSIAIRTLEAESSVGVAASPASAELFAACLGELAEVKRELLLPREAVALFQKAIEHLRSTSTADCEGLLPLYRGLASACIDTEAWTEAETALNVGISVVLGSINRLRHSPAFQLEQLLPTAPEAGSTVNLREQKLVEFLGTLYDLSAAVSLQLGEIEQACIASQAALLIAERSMGPRSLEACALRTSAITALYGANENDAALQLGLRALEQLPSEAAALCAVRSAYSGVPTEKMVRNSEADKPDPQADNVASATRGDNVRWLQVRAATLYNVAEVLRRKNFHELANTLERRSDELMKVFPPSERP